MKDRKEGRVSLENFNSKSRDKNLFKEISFAFLFKVSSILISLFLVPLLIGMLGDERYGIWATLLSFSSWILFLDIGIGNGLRNKLTQALAVGKINEARGYVSTAYFTLSGIVLILMCIILIIYPLINYQTVFNTSFIPASELGMSFIIVVLSILLNFVLSLVNQLFNAVQRNSLTAAIPLFVNILFISFLIFLKKYGEVDLVRISQLYSLSILIASISVTFLFFKNHAELRPTFSFFNKEQAKEITNLGGKFFFIQFATVVIFATDNIIITQLFSPADVTPYSVVRQLFGILNMVAILILGPLWSAFTEAFTKSDFIWIKRKLKILNLLILPLILIVFILFIFSDAIIKIWIGTDIIVDVKVKALMGVFVIISVWNNIYSFFLNGISRTKEQIITAIIGLVINIPLSVIFAKYFGLGPAGVILATIVSLSFFAIVGPITTYKLLKKSNK